jgi:hypothetical protein
MGGAKEKFEGVTEIVAVIAIEAMRNPGFYMLCKFLRNDPQNSTEYLK